MQPAFPIERRRRHAALASACLVAFLVTGAAALSAAPGQGQGADLAVEVAGPAEVAPGAQVGLRVTLLNRGPLAADVVLTQTVASPLVVLAASSGAEAWSGGLRWRLGQVAVGGERSLTLTVRVPRSIPVPGSVVSKAEARGSLADPRPVDNVAQWVATLGGADLRVEIGSLAGEVRPGERLTHTISLANVSNREAQGVVLTASLAAGTVWVADDGPAGGFSRELITGGVRWRRAALSGPSSHFIHLVTRVSPEAQVGSLVAHAVRVGAATLDPLPTNDADQSSAIPVVVPDMWLTKSGPPEAGVGEDVEYTLRLGNRGVGTAPAVVLTDTLPVGLAFLSALPPPVSRDGQRVVWSLERLPAGGEDLVRLRARVLPGRFPGDLVTNVAELSPGSPDANRDDNRAETTLRVSAGAPAALNLTVPATLAVSDEGRALAVSVYDTGGNPVANGTRVALTATRGTFTDAAPVTVDGLATTTYTPGRQAGVALLRAVAGSVAVTRTVTLQADPPATIRIQPGLSNPSVDDGVGLVVAVDDAFGNPVADGTEVALVTDLGTVVPALAQTVAGVANARWQSPVAARGLVTATAGTAAGSASVSFRPGRVASVSLVPGATELAVSEGMTPLLARVADQFGNPVTDPVDVRFEVSGGTVAPALVRTVDGRAQSTYRAAALPGRFIARAVVGQLASAVELSLRPADLAYVLAELSGPRGRARETQTHPGEPLTYDLEIQNSDLAAARAVVVAVDLPAAWPAEAVRLPAGTTEEADLPAGLLGPPVAGRVQKAWRLPDLAHAASARLILGGPVDRDYAWTGRDSLFIQTAVTTTTAVARTESLRRSDTAGIYTTDLYVTLGLDSLASQLVPGGTAVYDIKFGNRQPLTDAGQVRITNTVPAGMTFDHWQVTPGTEIFPAGEFHADTRELVWLPSSPFGLGAGLRLWLAIDPDVAPQASFENRVEIGSPVQDLAPADNVASDGGIGLRGVNLMAGLGGPPMGYPGESLNLGVLVRNTASQDLARNVVVDVYLAPGVEVLGSHPAGLVDHGLGRVRWQMEVLPAGGEGRFTVQARLPLSAALGSVLRHRTEVTSDEPERYRQDNSAYLETRIVPGPPARVSLWSERPAVLTCGPAARQSDIVAEVRDDQGHLVADGTPVRWSVSAGRLAPVEEETRGGLARAMFHGDGPPGLAYIGAGSGLVEASLPLELLPGLPADLTMGTPGHLILAGALADLWAQLKDACDQDVADGTPVRFSAGRGAFEGDQAGVTATTRGGRALARLAVGHDLGPLEVVAGHEALSAALVLEVIAVPPPTPPAPRRLYLPLISQRLPRP